ncbi:MAG: helix-turn-helix transcriptional regulator [Nitrospirota bacterium]
MRIFCPTKIKERRNKLGLTQAELAKKAGTAREYVVEIERGKAIPRASMIAKLANALRVRESYFFVDGVSNN